MCGIFGYLNDVCRPEIFLQLMSHRGPDATGFETIDRITLGHLRLSIIDTGNSANQPFIRDGACLVFNGEIYNYLELRDKYLLDARFKTQSDTEVLILLLNRFGLSILDELNGMFAFAYLDKHQKLHLVRDRFGVKPLYYCEINESLAFSSEIKPLIAQLEHSGLDARIVDSFLKDTASDYDENSGYSQIYSIKRGHYLSCSIGYCSPQQQWYIPIEEKTSLSSPNSLVDQCTEILLDAIRIRCRADVPLAITLSGGIDSTLIYTLLKEYLNVKIQPFVYKHPNPKTDESSLAIRLAREYGDEPIIVEQSQSSLNDLQDSLWFLEYPIWNPSAVAYFSMYRAIASRGYKVVLEGHGSDEQLAGYPYMMQVAAIHALSKANVARYVTCLDAFLKTCHTGLGQSISIRVLLKLLPMHLFKAAFSNPPSLSNCLNNSFDYKILPIVLRAFDRLTMAHSLESRMPFMDFRFVEFCKTLPFCAKVAKIGNKAILREILKKHGKTYIYSNKQKMGFSADVPVILSENSVRQYLKESARAFVPSSAYASQCKQAVVSSFDGAFSWTNMSDTWKIASLGVFSDPSFLRTKHMQ